VRIAITGVNLPGRVFCRADGSTMEPSTSESKYGATRLS
jgi:hypothetical protein